MELLLIYVAISALVAQLGASTPHNKNHGNGFGTCFVGTLLVTPVVTGPLFLLLHLTGED
jgi:hypothetical protein